MTTGDQPRGGHFCPNCGYNREPDPVVEFGGWTLNPRWLAAEFQGVPVHFTRSEFVMLYAVMAGNGDTVTRDVIRERTGTEADGNIIDVWAFRIRRKLSGTPVTIKSVFGTGYRVVESVPA